MSTLVSQPIPQPSWKEEVNRRLEAHKNRRGISVVENPQDEEHSSVSDRAAQAAARVAARFSKAPSYSEMQAAEARAALRVAEAATRAALEAQAAAQVALANLQTAEEESAERIEEFHAGPHVQEPAPRWEQEPRREPDPAPRSSEAGTTWKVRWEPDFPARAAAPAPEARRLEADSRENFEIAESPAGFQHHYGVTTVDAQPIHANLIHFPREIVATRRMRPRLATSAEEFSQQLSIFEVDPTTVSTEPMVAGADAAALEPSWAGPEWSSIELGAHPQTEPDLRHKPVIAPATQVHLAPIELRLMAAAVDLAVIVVLACAAAWGVAGHLVQHPTLKFAETSAVVGFVLLSLAYQAFFLLTAKSTPGMMYAGTGLCTFDDEYPTRKQLRDRLVALLISLLPVGLGMAWAIFDEDHLSWHDRLSRTYLRKC